MRHLLIFIIIFTNNTLLLAQGVPKFIQDRIDFCDSTLSDKQSAQLRKEVNELEDYFVKKRLLPDKSGSSYRAVYERIAKENDLNFEIDTGFELLDTLEFQVCTSCFYRVLTQEEISKLTLRHQEAAERIAQDGTEDISPGVIAQRILDNLTTQDFELEFYRVSSLLIFYRITSPKPNLDFGLPGFSANNKATIETIVVELDESNQIKVGEHVLTLKEVEHRIYQFLKIDPEKKGIEFSASRGASFESYMAITKMLDSVYATLTKELGMPISKNIILNEPK